MASLGKATFGLGPQWLFDCESIKGWGAPSLQRLRRFLFQRPVCRSVVTHSCGPLDCSPPGSCPWDSPGKNTGRGQPFPSPGDLPDPGIKPGSPALQADSLPPESPGKPLQCPGCLQGAHRSHSSLPCPFCPHRGHWFSGYPWALWPTMARLAQKAWSPFWLSRVDKATVTIWAFFLSLGAFHLFGHISVIEKPNKPVGPNCS